MLLAVTLILYVLYAAVLGVIVMRNWESSTWTPMYEDGMLDLQRFIIVVVSACLWPLSLLIAGAYRLGLKYRDPRR